MAGSRKRRMQQRTELQPSAKRQGRTRHDVTSNENSIETTKITDLNYDCLEKIFDRLDFKAFFNTALSNKSLQMAAASAFNRKFGVKEIDLDPTGHNPTSVRDNRIMIGGLKRCLQFVRCFGEIITDLVVLNNDSNVHLNQYIEQYCADTLIKISFRGGSIHRNSSRKQFKKVEVVSITDVHVKGNLSRFFDWFPHLQQMSIASKHQDRYVELLRANPQLQAIELTEQRMTMKRSLDIIKCLGSILKLKIKSRYRDEGVCVYPKDAKRLVRDHPLLVEVDLPKHRFNAKTAMILLRQLNALKMFQFEVNSQAEYDEIVKQLDGEWHHGAPNGSNWPNIVKLTR